MRVLVLNLTGGGLSGGYRKYLETLIPLLRADPRITQLEVIVPPLVTDSFQRAIGPLMAWPRNERWPSPKAIRRLVREAKPDVVFVPTARWIACDGTPVVNMVRNMEPLVDPVGDNSPADAVRNVLRAWLTRRSVHRATRVIAVSQFVRDFLVERWRVRADRVGVVRHGVSHVSDTDDARRAATIASLDAPDANPFLFAAGSVRSSRGLEDAIRALALITPQTPHTRLVIAGSPDPGTENYDRAMKRLARAQGVEERVVWAGHLGPADMAWCFRRAAAFIMTSRVEACPNTALEAMSEGALCLSTKNPPMPEFFGDAAAYYPAGDSAALARLLVDRALRATAGDVAASREAGRRRSRRYSWSDTAERTVGELLAAIG